MNLLKSEKFRKIFHFSFNCISGYSSQKRYCQRTCSLIGQLKARINAMGPLTVADYMKEVLINPASGYYQHKQVFGSSGDFITSPEISQMFGELLSVWFLAEWHKIGSPSPFQIIELGPGNGSLMQDILKVLVHFGVHKDVSVHLVEISQRLAAVQAMKLDVQLKTHLDLSSTAYQTGSLPSGIHVSWYSQVEEVPRNFSFIIANEFFDALPVHKFERSESGWREILVDINPSDRNCLRFVKSRAPTPATMFIKPNEKRDHVELSIATATIVEHLASRVEEDGGIVLLADYGHDGCATDTFRAFRDHKLHNPLVDPGSADLTADVDFSLIRDRAQAKLITFGPVTQRDFLERMGIQLRLKTLMEKSNPHERRLHEAAYHMLVDKDKMGERFKFFAMFPAVLSDHLKKYPVAGFS